MFSDCRMAEIRVVPRGKVYRQMFEAQVKLSVTLHDSRRSRAADRGTPLRDSTTPPRRVNGSSLQGHGSDARTRTSRSEDVTFSDWQCTAPRHRQRADEQTLPDIVVAEKLGSDINERLKERRLSRHKQAMAELEEDLRATSVHFEVLIKGTGEDFLRKISNCDENIERLAQKVNSISESDLCSCTLQEVQKLWDSVAQESEEQRRLIRELDRHLEQYDSNRTTMIAAILRKHLAVLEKISFLMPPDLHRMLDGEAMMINQAILANRRAVAKLIFVLTKKCLEKGLHFRLCWEQLMQDWTKLKVQELVDRFREFMGSPLIQSPPGVQATLDGMHTAQDHLSEACRMVLQAVRSMAPPKCSEALVTEWNMSLSAINEQIDALHIDSIVKLRSCYESTWQKCLAEVKTFKEEAAKYAISPDQVENIVKDDLLPMIAQCQKQPDEQLKTMNRTFESLAKRNRTVTNSLMKLARSATQLWEDHGARLQKGEEQLQVCLEKVRWAHQHQNQKKEVHLDVMLDKLRQESTKEALRLTLEKAISFLKDIKDGYSSFYQEEMDTVESYPALVLEEVRSYSSAVSLFFGVSATYDMDCQDVQSYFPLGSLDSRRLVDMETCSGMESQTHPGTRLSDQSVGLQYPQSSTSLLFTEDSPDTKQEEPSTLQMVTTFTTTKGNVYHMSFRSLEWADPEPSIPAVELVVYPSTLCNEIYKDMCVAFFNHLETWYHTALSNATSIVAAKKEELKRELDLQLALHNKRTQTVKTDVHDVRAEELVSHQKNVDEHCKVVMETLDRSKTGLNDLITLQQKQMEDFQTQVYSMEETFIAATKSDVLLCQIEALQRNLEKHTALVQAAHQSFRKELESQLGTLREANAQLIRSFRLFTEGGNFTPAETDVYQKQVEKLAKCIDSAGEAIVLETDRSECKHLDQAKGFVNKFLDKFHVRVSDLKFLEKIQRVLTNTQVQIKSESILSNMQKKKIGDMLVGLDRMIDACATPTLGEGENNMVRLNEVLSYAWSVNSELKKRLLYLENSAEPCAEDSLPVPGQQNTGAVPSSPAADSLLQPSRAGVPPGGDQALVVVRGLLQMGRSKVHQEVHPAVARRGATLCQVAVSQKEKRGPSTPAVNTPHKNSADARHPRRMACPVKRFSRPTRFDKRFHVFGSKPVEQDVATFTGLIFSILWKTNDLLLTVAEEFYKKEQRPISRLEALPESFELCAEEVNRRLLSYHSQAQEHCRGCLQEFRTQLRDFEERMEKVVELIIMDLVRQHLDALSKDTEQLRQHLKLKLNAFNKRKSDHHRQLSAHLSHPAFQEELEKLLQTEKKCQREEISTLHSAKQELQAVVAKHGDEFVSALASLTENLLLQMDSMLTEDEVQAVSPEVKKDTTLLREKTEGCVNEKLHTETASRTWAGLCYLQPSTKESLEHPAKRTASVTPMKMSLAHLKAIQASEARYEHFRQRFHDELARTDEEMQAQERTALCWHAEWQESVQAFLRLYSA